MSTCLLRKITLALILVLTISLLYSTNCSADAQKTAENPLLYQENTFDINMQIAAPLTEQNNTEDIYINSKLTFIPAYDCDLPEIHTIINNDADFVYIYSQTTKDALITQKITSGSECFVVEAFVDGLWHHVICGNIDGYISTVYLDLSNSDADYFFATEQDMRTKTGFSAEQLEKCLLDGMIGLGQYFAAAEQNYGVNALFLISICQIESCNGTSRLAYNKHNLAGMKGRSGFIYFASFEECINYMAEMLSNKYLDPQGAFYHGSTIKGVSTTYCGGSWYWVTHVSKMMQKNNDIIFQ